MTLNDHKLLEALQSLSTPHIADACLRIAGPVRCAPAGMCAISRTMRCAGRVLPVRHVGSVDIVFEALERARPGDVLVVDNEGRLDEACVGDLLALEARNTGLSGIVIWGLHRDTDELLRIGLPCFSLGSLPTGPQRLDPRSLDSLEWARVGSWVITANDFIAGDSDGLVFLPNARLQEIAACAAEIRNSERKQAAKMRAGVPLRQQVDFAGYLAARSSDPAMSFREHLRKVGRAIEE